MTNDEKEETDMKRLVVLVVLLAAIVPPMPCMADGFDSKVYNDPAMSARLSRVSAKVVSAVHQKYPDCKSDLRFRVYDDSELNAFAFPDGRIFVTKGMMEAVKTDAELAAVLNHEAVHVAEKHGKKQAKKALFVRLGSLILGRAVGIKANTADTVSQVTTGLVVGKRSRKDEQKADKGSVELCYLEGYDVHAPAKVMTRLRERYGKGAADTPVIGWFVSHPDTDGRIKAINAEAEKYGAPVGKVGEVKGRVLERTAPKMIGAIAVIVQDRASGGGGFFGGRSSEDAIKEAMESALEKTKRFTIADRESRDEAWREQDMPKERMDSTTVPSRGKTVGARFFLYVTLSHYQVTQEGEVRVGGWQKNADIRLVKAEIRGKVKLEPVEQSIVSYTGNFRGDEVGHETQAAYGRWTSGIDARWASHPAGQAVEEACRRAADEIVRYLDENTDNLAAATGNLRLLTEDGGNININITSGKFVEVGDYIVFYSKDKEIAKYQVLAIDGQDI